MDPLDRCVVDEHDGGGTERDKRDKREDKGGGVNSCDETGADRRRN